MRAWCYLLFLGCFMSPLACGQGAGSVTMDLLTLRMPVELAEQLQKRIEDGGPGAKAVMDRLPDLAKEKKLTELDRWNCVVGDDEVSKRAISRGPDLKLGDGEIQPSAINIEIQAKLTGNGTIDFRLNIESQERLDDTPSRCLSWQILTGHAARTNEWTCLGSRRDGDRVTMFLGKFSGSSNPAGAEGRLQASLVYRLCQFENSTPPNGPLSGEPARDFLKKARILEAGSLGVREDAPFVIGGTSLALNGKDDSNPPNFDLEGYFCFSTDGKTAEMKCIANFNPPRSEKRAVKFSFADYLALPVGTVTLVPVNGEKKLFIALEPKVKMLSSDPEKPSAHVVRTSPSARRLLAIAAGLPVPKPERNKSGFETLPKISESLTKLGLKLPPGVVLNARGTSIWMTGKNAPYKQLREILAKHLAPADGALPE